MNRMASGLTTAVGIAGAAVIAVGSALMVTGLGSGPPQVAVAGQATQWSAAAPGRVEPKLGEVRLAIAAPGRISEIAVAVNERVLAGDLLLRLEDEDARARVAAADAEAAVRRRERDTEPTNNRLAADRRLAEDAVAAAERSFYSARVELDRLLRAKRLGTAVTDEAIAAERGAIAATVARLEAERLALRRAQTAQGVPLPTRLEAGLTAARADLSLAETALERTKLRAPAEVTVLQVIGRVGEIAAATPEQPLLVVGDLSAMRVRAEVEERDISKISVGQTVLVRTDAYAGREFAGKVATVARTLAPGRLSQRGPRRPTDLDSLEVMIDLDLVPELLPGMRVDVFFSPPVTAKVEPVAPAAPSPVATPAAPVPAKK